MIKFFTVKSVVWILLMTACCIAPLTRTIADEKAQMPMDSDVKAPFAFAQFQKSVGKVDNDDAVGLCSSHHGVVTSKKDGTILSICDE